MSIKRKDAEALAADIAKELGSHGIDKPEQIAGIIMYIKSRDVAHKEKLLTTIGSDEDYRGNGSPVNEERQKMRKVVEEIYI